MKTIRNVLAQAAVFTMSAVTVLAISLPVAEDTYYGSTGVLTPAAGKAPTLILKTNQAALLKFDLSTLPTAYTATNIANARLKLYIVNARTPGDLVAHLITSAWTESALSNTVAPSFDPTMLGTVPAAKIAGRRFVSVDVTAAVVAALSGETNFGFLLRDNVGQTSLASKEGPSQGPAAELEIDANLAQNSSGGGMFPGSLNVGGDFNLAGLLRQGSETGTAEPAGRGIIVRRIQSTNAAIGSVVARTDTLTLERDGTPDGFRIVNSANAGYWIAVATGADWGRGGAAITSLVYPPNDTAAGTNALRFCSDVFGCGLYPAYFRCSFGDPSSLGHQTEISLFRNSLGGSVIWTGYLISTFNQ
jgi:hypothetical protein